jgi:hypothetical protein
MIYSSLLRGATSPAYYGLSLPDLDPYPASPRSILSAPTRQSRPSANVYFVIPLPMAPNPNFLSRTRHSKLPPPCLRARASLVAGP